MPTTSTGLSRPRTRGVVLDLIRSARSISRVELVTASGLTGGTISNVVRELIADGLVIEAGRTESTGGKPRTLLELNASARYTVGVQLDRGSAVIVVVDLAGHLIARTSMGGSGTRSPHETLVMVADHIESLLMTTGVDRADVLGVGFVTHGPQDTERGRLLVEQPTEQWQNYPIVDDLETLVDLPVVLDNDATAAALGEFWIGGVHPSSTYAAIYMASGIGGGVVVEGVPYRGSSGNGVEIGHVSLDVDGPPCECGNRGCLENYAGPTTVIARARMQPELAARLGLTEGPTETVVNFARIARAASRGDAAAREIIDESARYIGKAAVSLANLFDLELIVLAGPSFTSAGANYLARVQDELDRSTFVRHVHPTKAALSVSGADAAAVGGAVLVLQSELTPLDLRKSDGRALTYTYQ
jgi:predicted NBD/HSP70 family sugar kinase